MLNIKRRRKEYIYKAIQPGAALQTPLSFIDYLFIWFVNFCAPSALRCRQAYLVEMVLLVNKMECVAHVLGHSKFERISKLHNYLVKVTEILLNGLTSYC